MVAAPPPKERAYGVTNIKSHIPITLDLNDHNYDAWRELFMTHCLSFDVIGHLDGTLLPNGDNDTAWLKRDGLVKLWIYCTLAQPLFRSSFKPGGFARDVWIRIENQFRNNKEARAIALNNELRTTEIGDMAIQEYCQKIKSLADLLSNVDAPVNERTLVMYLLNGLNEKYDNIINVIKHKEPFPSFDNAKSMLEMEEKRLKKPRRATASYTNNASSSSALTVSDSTNQQQRPQSTKSNHNNNKGNRRFNNRGRGNNQRNYFQNWPQSNNWNAPFMSWPPQFINWNPYTQAPTYSGPQAQPLAVPQQQR